MRSLQDEPGLWLWTHLLRLMSSVGVSDSFHDDRSDAAREQLPLSAFRRYEALDLPPSLCIIQR